MNTTQRVAGAGVGVGAVVALLIPFVAGWEGFSPDPFIDMLGTGKPVTWCFGETQGTPKDHYTRDECEVLLGRSLVKYAGPVLECLPKDAPIEVKAAFTSFAYNAGSKAACNSSAAGKARVGNYAAACDGLTAWVYARGRRVQGLVNRRAAERQLCLRGLLR